METVTAAASTPTLAPSGEAGDSAASKVISTTAEMHAIEKQLEGVTLVLCDDGVYVPVDGRDLRRLVHLARYMAHNAYLTGMDVLAENAGDLIRGWVDCLTRARGVNTSETCC